VVVDLIVIAALALLFARPIAHLALFAARPGWNFCVNHR
jgi:hypothetical protein